MEFIKNNFWWLVPGVLMGFVSVMKYFNGTEGEIDKILGGTAFQVNYSLSIITQSLTEAEMIMEQIIPQFTPFENITIQEFDFLPELTRDIKINLVGVEPDFIEEVDQGDIRRIEVNLDFEADIWFYRPVLVSDVIKVVKAEFYDSTLVPSTSAVHLTTYTYEVSGDSKDNFDVLTDEWTDEF